MTGMAEPSAAIPAASASAPARSVEGAAAAAAGATAEADDDDHAVRVNPLHVQFHEAVGRQHAGKSELTTTTLTQLVLRLRTLYD